MELRELAENYRKQKEQFKEEYRNKIIELLKECGFWEVDVIANNCIRGRIKVEPKFGSAESDIAFHPYTKSGVLSKNSKYVGCWISFCNADEEIKTKLRHTFTIAEEG